jgi:hypothetical protein
MRGQHRSLTAIKRPIFQRASRSLLGALDAPMYRDGWWRWWRRASLVLAEFIGVRAEGAALCPFATRVDLLHDFDQPGANCRVD